MRFQLTVAVLFVVLMMFAAGCSDRGTEAPLKPPVEEPPTQEISFQQHIKPIFQRHGCNGCHGGSGGLFVQTVAQLLQGGDHGPVIVSGSADSSNIVKKLSPAPPFGDRMPQGGPYLPDTTMVVIRTWINQGAKNN